MRRPPWTLYRYVFLEIFLVFLISLLAVSFVSIGAICFRLVYQEGLNLVHVWPLLLKTLALPLYFSIPIALLFGTTLGLGRMTADLEITAMRASGISFGQIIAPIAAFAALLCAVSWLINTTVVPRLHYELRNKRELILRQLQDLGHGRGRRIRIQDGTSVVCDRFDGNHLYGLQIFTNRLGQGGQIVEDIPPEKRFPATILAREGVVEIDPSGSELLITLKDAQISFRESQAQQRALKKDFFQKARVAQLPLRFSLRDRHPGLRDRTTANLYEVRATFAEKIAGMREELAAAPGGEERDRVRDDLRRHEGYLREIRAEIYRRRTFAISSLSFFGIGAPLALLLERRSRLVPFFIGNLIVVVFFYPLLMLGSLLSERGIAPEFCMASPNLVLLAIGGGLFWWLSRK